MTDLYSSTICIPKYTSARPEVRGTANVGWQSLFPFSLILFALTHDFIITCGYGPTGNDGHKWVIPKRTLVAHLFRCHMWRRGWCTSRAPYDHLFGPQHELPPARLALHRQTSAQNSVGDARDGSDEVGHISVFMQPATTGCG